jgi:hypothetical protein
MSYPILISMWSISLFGVRCIVARCLAAVCRKATRVRAGCRQRPTQRGAVARLIAMSARATVSTMKAPARTKLAQRLVRFVRWFFNASPSGAPATHAGQVGVSERGHQDE